MARDDVGRLREEIGARRRADPVGARPTIGASRMACCRRASTMEPARRPVRSGWLSALRMRDEELVEPVALARLEVAERERHEVERARPLGRLEVAGEREHGLLVEAVEPDGGGAHEPHVADERDERLLGAAAQAQAVDEATRELDRIAAVARQRQHRARRASACSG